MGLLTLSRRQLPGAVLITVGGELDAATARELEAFIRQSWSCRTDQLVFDLSEVPFMDSWGLRVLLNTYSMAKQHGGFVHLAGLQRQLIRVIQITQVGPYLRVHETVQQALQSALAVPGRTDTARGE